MLSSTRSQGLKLILILSDLICCTLEFKHSDRLPQVLCLIIFLYLELDNYLNNNVDDYYEFRLSFLLLVPFHSYLCGDMR